MKEPGYNGLASMNNVASSKKTAFKHHLGLNIRRVSPGGLSTFDIDLTFATTTFDHFHAPMASWTRCLL